MIYTHAAAFLAGLALAAASAWHIQAWRYDAQIEGIKAHHAAESAKAQADVRAQELAFNQRLQDAQNAATKRETKLRADAAAARRTADGLRAQLDGVPARISRATDSAVREYATTASAVLGECIGEYQALAGQADKHANDARLMREAWPK